MTSVLDRLRESTKGAVPQYGRPSIPIDDALLMLAWAEARKALDAHERDYIAPWVGGANERRRQRAVLEASERAAAAAVLGGGA